MYSRCYWPILKIKCEIVKKQKKLQDIAGYGDNIG